MFKIGIGQDSHGFTITKQKPLILGGITLSPKDGLQGNSDGDVILHSICNAISSGIGGDSLSTWTDNMCLKKGIIDSKKYIRYIMKKIGDLHYIIGNISIAVEAKRPIIPLKKIHEMKTKIAELLQITKEQVGITFTSGEKMTSFGRGKGIQAFSIVILFKQNDTSTRICKT